MGSGKSTLGKKLANKLAYDFIDLDLAIEEQEQLSISEIFKERGEEYFRKAEQKALKSIANSSKKLVIALGGGTPCFFDNMDLINQSGVSIYLKYNSGILAHRLLNAKTERPLIIEKNKEELIDFIEKTLKEREIYYTKSKFIIEKTNVKIDDILSLIQN